MWNEETLEVMLMPMPMPMLPGPLWTERAAGDGGIAFILGAKPVCAAVAEGGIECSLSKRTSWAFPPTEAAQGQTAPRSDGS